MIVINDKSNCNGCHACFNICPKKCIEMKADDEGFLYPVIEQAKCINCNKCEKVCPVLNGKTENPDSLQIGYAAYNKDEKIRMNSSSGGIFTLIAEQIINQGGIVIGAAMAEDCKSVHHIAVDNINDLEKLRGSKYVQSSIRDTYVKAEEFLKDGKKVLFTGTPCQIGGLYSYLGKDYENLYTQDLICHGVPSPLVWKKYAEIRENENAAKLRRTFFRHKKYGWKRFALSLEFSNDKAYHKSLDSDLYLKGFLSNLYLRPSCHNCSFKTVKRQADITLADFWGVERLLPSMDDDKGTSFVWIHSQKGISLFEDLSDKIQTTDISIEKAIKINSAAIRSVSENKNRKDFFAQYNKQNIIDLIERMTRKNIVKKVLSKIKNWVVK